MANTPNTAALLASATKRAATRAAYRANKKAAIAAAGATPIYYATRSLGAVVASLQAMVPHGQRLAPNQRAWLAQQLATAVAACNTAMAQAPAAAVTLAMPAAGAAQAPNAQAPK